MVYSQCTSKSGTSLKACKSTIFVTPHIYLPLHCAKVLWHFEPNWPSYRPVKWCLICWIMRYTPIFGTPELYRPLYQKLWYFEPKWPSYRPSKWCLIFWFMRYTPIFCPFLAPLRYTNHCAKVSWRFDQNSPNWCLICWCMWYTPIFFPI